AETPTRRGSWRSWRWSEPRRPPRCTCCSSRSRPAGCSGVATSPRREMVRARTAPTFDVALAAVLVAGSVVGVLTTQLPRSREVDGWALSLAVGAAVLTLARRSWPVVTAGVITASTSLYLLVGYPYSPILVSF